MDSIQHLQCFIGALWVSRRLSSGHLLHGALFGSLFAAVDIAILVAAQAPFEWLFVASNAGRVLASIAGGLVSARTTSGTTATASVDAP